MRSDRLARVFEEVLTFADGESIVRAGDDGQCMFVIQQGEVVITRRPEGRKVEVAVLGRGDFFGEMSVLEGLPRDADATARGDVCLLSIGQGAMLVRLRRDPSFAVELLRSLSARVRDLNARLDGANLHVEPVRDAS